MPICKKNRLIYVHIPKTGGTSIEKLFGMYNENSHIPDLDKLHGHVPVENSKKVNNPLSLGGNYGYYLQHLSINEIKGIIPDHIYIDKNIFTCIRNPWDRIVSEYIWAYSFLKFDDFINKVFDVVSNRIMLDTENVHFRPQNEFLNSELNYICRFEEFKNDLGNLIKSLSLNINVDKIPHEKKSIRNHYSQYYSNKSIALIEEIYAKDIEIYGYSYQNKQ